MQYFFSVILAVMLSAAFIYPAAARPHKPKIHKGVLKEIQKARLTGRYGDLTGKPAACDCADRNSDQITRIILHSTHVAPSLSFKEVVNHSLTNCAFTHYYIDRDGTVIQRFRDLQVAPHTRSIEDAVNQSSIGIELYSTTAQERSRTPFTSKQIDALQRLTARLMNTYHINISQVFRHADYSPRVDCLTIPESYKGNCQAYVNDHLDPYGWTDKDWGKFVSRFRTIEVLKSGEGTGTVSCKGVSGIPGRDISTDCAGTVYIANPVGKSARVILKATPDPDSVFTGWSGACKGTKPCTVRMDSAKTVSATFGKTTKATAMNAESANHTF